MAINNATKAETISHAADGIEEIIDHFNKIKGRGSKPGSWQQQVAKIASKTQNPPYGKSLDPAMQSLNQNPNSIKNVVKSKVPIKNVITSNTSKPGLLPTIRRFAGKGLGLNKGILSKLVTKGALPVAGGALILSDAIENIKNNDMRGLILSGAGAALGLVGGAKGAIFGAGLGALADDWLDGINPTSLPDTKKGEENDASTGASNTSTGTGTGTKTGTKTGIGIGTGIGTGIGIETNQKEYTPVEWVQKDREIGEKNLDIIIDRLNKDAQIEKDKTTGKTDMETWAEMYPGLAKRAYAKKVVSDARKEDPVPITERTTDQEVDDPAKIIDSYTPVEWVQGELESGDFSNIGSRDQSRLNPYGISQKGTKTGVSPIGDSEVGLAVEDPASVSYLNPGSGFDSNQLWGTDASPFSTQSSNLTNPSDFLNGFLKSIINSLRR